MHFIVRGESSGGITLSGIRRTRTEATEIREGWDLGSVQSLSLIPYVTFKCGQCGTYQALYPRCKKCRDIT